MITYAALHLFIADVMRSEAEYEVQRRAQQMRERRGLQTEETATLLREVEFSLTTGVTVLARSVYEARVAEAQDRIPRDSSDAPTVALALALDCGIWTGDRGFFGCGLPVWSTEVLRRYLEQPRRNGG